MPIKITDLSSLRHYSPQGPMSLPVFTDRPDGHIVCLEPGQQYQGESDGHRLVYIVLEGQGELTAADRQRQLGISAMAMVEPGTDHILKNNRDDRFAVLRIQTRP